MLLLKIHRHYLLFVVIVLFLPSSLIARDNLPGCRVLSQKLIRVRWEGRGLDVEQGAEAFSVSDPVNKRLQVAAYLYAGRLEITIRTKLENGTRSTMLHGNELMADVFRFFAGRIEEVKDKYSYGDNLKMFNKAKSNGLGDAEAAFATWSGKQARKAGFREVKKVRYSGIAPHISNVEVIYYRPPFP